MNITVRKTTGGNWVAYLGDDTSVFEVGKNESEAVGRLIITLSYIGLQFSGKMLVNRRFA